MIEIHIQTKENKICRLDIQGHANFRPHGEDLVCAGVSSIAIGLLNALDQLANGCECAMFDNHIQMIVRDSECLETQIVLKTGIIQLETIQESFKKYIKIDKQEV